MKHDKTGRREVELDLDRYDDEDDLDIRNDELGEPSRRDASPEEQQPLRFGEEGRNGTIRDHDSDGQSPEEETKKESNKPVAWKDLPRRQQLIIITLARLSEPLVQTSLQAYLFYQLKSFDPSLPDSTISNQAGIMHASFMAAQFVTAMIWGRIADSPLAGRKTVLLIGLLGTSLSCVGFGFSKNFWQALVFRTMGGITNGNVGVMRTMISEIIREKKYQSRAFLLLPMTFNIGIIVGPVLGGVLSDPAGSYPSLFGGIPFFENFPYATPNIVSAFFLFCAAAAVWLGLEETLDAIRDSGHIDIGSRIGHRLAALFRRRRHDGGPDYSALPAAANADDEEVLELPETPTTPNASSKPLHAPHAKRFTQRLAFRRIFTRNVIFTFFTHFLIAFHAGTFNSLWFVFLSTPVYDPAKSDGTPATDGLPFRFTGGLGLQPRSVGIAMAVLGAIGITMQLTLYPRISGRLGTIRSWRYFLCCFPIAYFLVPYLAVVPSTSPPPESKTGPAMWAVLFVILFVQVLSRTFALPAQHILVNNCSPHPSVLGTVHGLGQSASSGARTIGPMIGGYVYGVGLNADYVGLVWWCLSAIAVCNVMASLLVREGDGHEIWLEGDKEE